ncbi:MAG: TRAP transporter small permease subunit [Gammaproteobacteria bacterium]|nr:TRAP transporter small permease subunit [Gammaproteobacteria bacterium]NIU03592.1 TRAP transporter small permease subunit [Gammaproteobacteria bacterium]NIX84866.1 TRAP transporter small permease subunit [Gammaproteobacteria bacterium]
MEVLRRVCWVLEVVVDRTGRIGGWILFATVALVFLNAFNRYAFSFSPVWAQELEWHLLAGQAALGLAYAWLHGDHIAVDVLSQRYSRTIQLWLNLLVAAVIAIPCSLFMIKVAIPYVDRAFDMLEGSPNPGGLPYRFVPKSLVAVGFLLIALQAAAIAIKSALELLGHERPAPPRAS